MLMSGEMAKIAVPIPPLEEQQRIATCLCPLDAPIAAEWRKLDGLRAHKKGLMQQLFPVVGAGLSHARARRRTFTIKFACCYSSMRADTITMTCHAKSSRVWRYRRTTCGTW
jgi:hypothetical protein